MEDISRNGGACFPVVIILQSRHPIKLPNGRLAYDMVQPNRYFGMCQCHGGATDQNVA